MRRAQKGKEDLSMFRDSSVSFYDPGDTAADSVRDCARTMRMPTAARAPHPVLRASGRDLGVIPQAILPREVLENDGSRTDRNDAEKPQRNPNYSDSHWYKTGQGSDPHGDLQEQNRARRYKEQRAVERQHQVDAERQRRAEQEQQEAEQARMRRRRAAALQQLRDRRTLHARWGHAKVPSYKEMQQELAKEDAAKQAHVLKHAGLHGGVHAGRHDAHYEHVAVPARGTRGRGQTTYAYKHPFAADKLGMQNLVMAEFSQDEDKMKATTAAIFGNKPDKSKWSHGGLLLSDVNQAPPRTLHEAMKERRERMRAQAKQQELSAEAQMRRHEAKHAREPRPREHRAPAKPHLRCTIEMLEHGKCSTKPHVGTHGDIPQSAAASHATSHATAAATASTTAAASRGERTQAHAQGHGTSSARGGHKGSHKAHAHPQTVVQVPTAGTVMTGWAKDVGSWF